MPIMTPNPNGAGANASSENTPTSRGIAMATATEYLAARFNSFLENISPTSVIYFRDSTFCQHVVADSNKNFKLLFSGEIMWLSTCSDHLEHLCFSSDHDQR